MKGRDLKPHVGIFGRRNNGKSSLINYLTGQTTAIVADEPGTTTDPVRKSVEIFGVGPAIVVDTAGIDDSGAVGKLRVDKALKIIPTIDMAILVIANNQFGQYEEELVKRFENYTVPFMVLHNKADVEPLSPTLASDLKNQFGLDVLDFSTTNPTKKESLIELIKQTIPKTAYASMSLFKGVVKPKDVVLLVTPIDSEAPEGRMILPQVMAWRDLLDNDCICMSVKESELEDFFRLGIKPNLVVTDSQAFELVSSIVPPDVPLTGFSVVFARYRGDFEKYIEGTPAIDRLQDGDKVLILESCTHQVSCDDIGRFKIPRWLEKYTGKKLHFDVVAGFSDLLAEPSSYKLAIQCGGCVVTAKQLKGRLKPFVDAGIPVTNYGLAIAYVNGIFDRITKPFVNCY
jgi:[FeFe] hydrogenase H-cluster maturation GTPase HydF